MGEISGCHFHLEPTTQLVIYFWWESTGQARRLEIAQWQNIRLSTSVERPDY